MHDRHRLGEHGLVSCRVVASFRTENVRARPVHGIKNPRGGLRYGEAFSRVERLARRLHATVEPFEVALDGQGVRLNERDLGSSLEIAERRSELREQRGPLLRRSAQTRVNARVRDVNIVLR